MPNVALLSRIIVCASTAEAPVGLLRFAPAQPKLPWAVDQRLNAHEYGHQCLQGSPLSGDEDCLLLNVWRAAGTTSSSSPVPVMLWIHGGSFNGGTGGSSEGLANPFDGRHLVARGVIVIAINYRLGAMGFLPVHEGVGGGSGRLNGVNDMIAALQWVQDNVRSFGGDPNQITVFGESAGSIAICMLSVSPRASGLFHRAVMESGTCLGSSSHDPADDKDNAHAAAELRGMNTSAVMALSYGPGVDGWVLPRPATELLQESGGVNINVDSFLMGANSFDGLYPW